MFATNYGSNASGVHVINPDFRSAPRAQAGLNTVPDALGSPTSSANIYANSGWGITSTAAIAVVGGLYALDQISGNNAGLLIATIGCLALGATALNTKSNPTPGTSTTAPVVARVASNVSPEREYNPPTPEELAHMRATYEKLVGNRQQTHATSITAPALTATTTSSSLPTAPPPILGAATNERNIQTNIHNASTYNAGSVFKCMAKTLVVGVGGALYGAPLVATAAITLACYLPALACIGVGASIGYAIDTLCGNGGALGHAFNKIFYDIEFPNDMKTPKAAIAVGSLIGILPLLASGTVAISALGLPRLILSGVSCAGAGLISTGVEDQECFKKLGLVLLAANADFFLYGKAK